MCHTVRALQSNDRPAAIERALRWRCSKRRRSCRSPALAFTLSQFLILCDVPIVLAAIIDHWRVEGDLCGHRRQSRILEFVLHPEEPETASSWTSYPSTSARPSTGSWGEQQHKRLHLEIFFAKNLMKWFPTKSGS